MGLVNEVVPGDRLTSRARQVAAAMAECPPEVLAAAKRALEFGESHGMEESMRNEERTSAELRRARGR
jgi:enoyl-CoA hydratase/carnithine racemase